jgi:hypothetical protein
MATEYHVAVNSNGIRHLIGEIISTNENGIVFQFKQPRSSKRLRVTVPSYAIILIKENGIKSELIFQSPSYEVVRFTGVTNVRQSKIVGLSVGEAKKGETLHFSSDRAFVASLHEKTKRERKATKSSNTAVKKSKGKPIKAQAW